MSNGRPNALAPLSNEKEFVGIISSKFTSFQCFAIAIGKNENMPTPSLFIVIVEERVSRLPGKIMK